MSARAAGRWLAISLVAMHPTSSVTWIGTDNFGVFRTDSDGLAWQSAHDGFDSLGVDKMIFDPTPPGTLHAATGLGLYRSRNRGASWTPAVDGRQMAIKCLRSAPRIAVRGIEASNDTKQPPWRTARASR